MLGYTVDVADKKKKLLTGSRVRVVAKELLVVANE
ncbi:hypothetical protein M2128_001780 [Polynucleobacter sphagniphilus]|uniref:Uncharacterized protein n=1 Tax=Polynucleobacter sphagniphilus TaxID=1743169 RepID=A0AA43M8A8_9BURK|nr:hypothetical protein [Polynucleobacter sphagniphilus]MDH6248985.1 hypothetical protein [Polynucleobacter sphagniphilus]MDH6299201.1 hypothetical protein [Polynucleobacter sphagniphilus]MDH6302839.1 hypothetical protein [Polynucleobacter sphagniphilus]MDH6504046.1 hypothetical protein [Polynucleobacter sphagniphilus]